ncbi:hypothetical protein BHM03_00031828 [Ensete ventricosum]|nr:hypothetical protein BHM03_00031828 [Ensete ventricosum]
MRKTIITSSFSQVVTPCTKVRDRAGGLLGSFDGQVSESRSLRRKIVLVECVSFIGVTFIPPLIGSSYENVQWLLTPSYVDVKCMLTTKWRWTIPWVSTLRSVLLPSSLEKFKTFATVVQARGSEATGNCTSRCCGARAPAMAAVSVPAPASTFNLAGLFSDPPPPLRPSGEQIKYCSEALYFFKEKLRTLTRIAQEFHRLQVSLDPSLASVYIG